MTQWPPPPLHTGKGFDFELGRAVVQERRIRDIFWGANFATGRVELKTEHRHWERSGNICLEYRYKGQPSGVALPNYDIWVHQLQRHAGTVGWFIFERYRIVMLARTAYRAGQVVRGAGDNGNSDVILVRMADIWQ